jgi:hypothetical protein
MDVHCKFCGEPFDHGELNSSPTLRPDEAFFGLDEPDYATDCHREPIESPERMERIRCKWEFADCLEDYRNG